VVLGYWEEIAIRASVLIQFLPSESSSRPVCNPRIDRLLESSSQHWERTMSLREQFGGGGFLYGALALIGQYQHSAFSVVNKPREKSKFGSLVAVTASRKV